MYISNCAVIITLLLARLIPYENQLSGKVNFINVIILRNFISYKLNLHQITIYDYDIHYKTYLGDDQMQRDVLEGGMRYFLALKQIVYQMWVIHNISVKPTVSNYANKRLPNTNSGAELIRSKLTYILHRNNKIKISLK